MGARHSHEPTADWRVDVEQEGKGGQSPFPSLFVYTSLNVPLLTITGSHPSCFVLRDTLNLQYFSGVFQLARALRVTVLQLG